MVSTRRELPAPAKPPVAKGGVVACLRVPLSAHYVSMLG